MKTLFILLGLATFAFINCGAVSVQRPKNLQLVEACEQRLQNALPREQRLVEVTNAEDKIQNFDIRATKPTEDDVKQAQENSGVYGLDEASLQFLNSGITLELEKKLKEHDQYKDA